jgi:hypothetical protein
VCERAAVLLPAAARLTDIVFPLMSLINSASPSTIRLLTDPDCQAVTKIDASATGIEVCVAVIALDKGENTYPSITTPPSPRTVPPFKVDLNLPL